MVSLQQGALQIFCGALGTLGFALFFFVRPKHLLFPPLAAVVVVAPNEGRLWHFVKLYLFARGSPR